LHDDSFSTTATKCVTMTMRHPLGDNVMSKDNKNIFNNDRDQVHDLG